jgi:uncharacterized protein YaiI (UPF0178 family)
MFRRWPTGRLPIARLPIAKLPIAKLPIAKHGEARMHVYIDADACPVKAEVYKVALRHGVGVTVVANSHMAVAREPWLRLVVVSGTPDAADDWIVEHARPGDVVVTADVPLASRCVKAGASVLAPTGRHFTEDSVGMALATRNLMDHLRSTGEVTGGPRPFTARDRSEFLGALDRVIVRTKRRAT